MSIIIAFVVGMVSLAAADELPPEMPQIRAAQVYGNPATHQLTGVSLALDNPSPDVRYMVRIPRGQLEPYVGPLLAVDHQLANCELTDVAATDLLVEVWAVDRQNRASARAMALGLPELTRTCPELHYRCGLGPMIGWAIGAFAAIVFALAITLVALFRRVGYSRTRVETEHVSRLVGETLLTRARNRDVLWLAIAIAIVISTASTYTTWCMLFVPWLAIRCWDVLVTLRAVSLLAEPDASACICDELLVISADTQVATTPIKRRWLRRARARAIPAMKVQ